MTQPVDIRPVDLAIVHKILRDALPCDARVWVFGSRAKWTTKDSSDLDLAIDADRALTRKESAALSDAFEESDLPYKVDVVDMHTVSDSFKAIIERNKVALPSPKPDWRPSTWGDEISLEYGKSLRDYAGASGPVRVYGSNGPIGYTDKALSEGPGVILGRKGAYRGVEYSKGRFFVIDTAYYVAPKTELEMRWIYYAIKHHKLGEIDDGSPIPSTTRSAVYVRDLDVPDIAEQKAIAAILGALDDKIELNRRMNATLEAMARALFKSWFVDFDPVRAKSEGRHPFGMDAETAALFPSRLVPSALGDIPEGWTSGTLGDVAVNPRTVVQPHELSSETPYIGLEHMPRRCIALTDWGQADDVSSHKSAFVRGDLLFGKLRPYFHKVGIAAVDGISSTDIAIVRARQKEFYAFTLSVISSDGFVEYTSQLSNGAKMPRINWSDMAKYELALPTQPIAQAYDAAIEPLLKQVIASIHENRRLSKLRDYLLPKLISGDIRIPDAEKLVGTTQ